MTKENWALFFHLLSAFLFVSGAVIAAVAYEAARRRTSPAEIAAVLQVARIGAVLVGPTGLLTVAFGLWLVRIEHVGYGTGWVAWAIVLFVATAAIGGFAGRKPRQAREVAERGQDPRVLLDDPLTRVLNYVAILLVVAIIVLMVFKP